MITTPRLHLVPLDAPMMRARLERDDVTLACATPEGPRAVRFGPEWPGDAIALFPGWLAAGDAVVEGTFVAVDRALGEAVALLGTRGPVDAAGRVEIGYGTNRSACGRGVATEAVRALAAWLLATPGVTRVTARTAVANVASQRVLEKAGFARVGTSWDEEDGDLVDWERGAVAP